MEQTRVLVVDDAPENVQALAFELEDDGCLVFSANSGLECLEQAAKELPDIILLDIQMPGMSGIETLDALKKSKALRNIPVIMVSANDDGDNVIKALGIGAHDFVGKPITYPILSARIDSALRLSRALEKLEIANVELNKLACTDGLTGCYNRRHFFTLANAEFSRSRRHKCTLSTIMFDIDHFKSINDTYGHAAGDSALKTLTILCQQITRESDIFARLGGEEFALCCPETNLSGVNILAEKIRKGLEVAIIDTEDQTFSLTVSLGVSELMHDDLRFDQMLQRADSLLYEAKNNGRNRTISDSLSNSG